MSGSHLRRTSLSSCTRDSARAHPLRNPSPARSKNIGECKSKQEEDKILTNEVSVLKQRFTESLLAEEDEGGDRAG